MAKLPRHGTIGKNHILSRSSTYRICFFICSKYDTFLKDYTISALFVYKRKRILHIKNIRPVLLSKAATGFTSRRPKNNLFAKNTPRLYSMYYG